jgi:hypothetical protein
LVAKAASGGTTAVSAAVAGGTIVTIKSSVAVALVAGAGVLGGGALLWDVGRGPEAPPVTAPVAVSASEEAAELRSEPPRLASANAPEDAMLASAPLHAAPEAAPEAPVAAPAVLPATSIARAKEAMHATEAQRLKELAEGLAVETRTLEQRLKEVAGNVMDAVDVLASRLALDARAQSDAEEVVADVKAQLLALRRLPDDNDRTWEQAQADSFRMVNGVRVLNDLEVLGWRKRRPRGAADDDTYGAREARILQEGRARLRDVLPSSAQPDFDLLDLTPLFGPHAPGVGRPSLGPPSAPRPTAASLPSTR